MRLETGHSRAGVVRNWAVVGWTSVLAWFGALSQLGRMSDFTELGALSQSGRRWVDEVASVVLGCLGT